MSKAALNMGMQALGADLKSEGVAVAVLSPGTADTAMFAAYRAGYATDHSGQSPATAVAGMIRVIDGLDPERAAQGILRYDGTLVGW
jgi:NAD(P)-dependent dehydrogenase (short-subunit alcohol dehydrogenase family)